MRCVWEAVQHQHKWAMALLQVSECEAVGIDGVHGHGACVCVVKAR
jgi:hypothetical protein